MKELATLFISLVFPVVGLLFVVRAIVAAFSTKTSEQIRRYPVIHIVWGGVAFLGVLVFLGVLTPNTWPMNLIQRHEQRATVAERVQSAGGWTTLQKDCEVLADQNRDNGFVWFHHPVADLPPSIAALKPIQVRFDSPKVLRELNEPPVPVVHIKVFGAHVTGGVSIPNFWLDVVCGTNAESYLPKPSRDGYDRVTDRIYEVY